MKKYKVISKCPICDGDLSVKVLECEHCNSSISGEFRLSKFDYLNDEQLYFIEVFIKNKGSIKGVEKDLNISYPTVKKYLDDVIMSLGYQISDDEEPADFKTDRNDVFEQLSKRLINIDEAVTKLKNLK